MIEAEENPDVKHGLTIVKRACQIPVKTIVSNAGGEGSVVVEKLLESDDPHWGYDASTGEYKDLVAAGVIDPRKVTRVALQDAAGVASLMCTTEAMVVDLPEEPGAGGAAPGGGMP